MIRQTIAALCVLAFTAGGASAQAKVNVDLDDPIGTIRPEIYGQFAEHLGAGIYGGIWVGPDSPIPNTDGVRDDVFAALDALHVPVIRWPGGCFADQYNWRDGIGPREERPLRVNVTWGGAPEPNAFGTHEFFNLAERLGAKTYLNLNLGTGTPAEGRDWLEYLTSDVDSDVVRERKRNGRDAPWKVDFLAIGNETWGCGGNLSATAYADLYARHVTFAKTPGEQPVRILSGSHDGNPEYTDTLLGFDSVRSLAEGVSLHYYTLPTGDWGNKGASYGFDVGQWDSTIVRTLKMDRFIGEQLAIIDAHEFDKPFDLYIDEWGIWTDDPNPQPGHELMQQSTIRDAVAAALNLNIFHAHADRVAMTNIAQMVNVLQAMILTDGPNMLLTPTYHVFEMYSPFQGAEALKVSVDSPVHGTGDDAYPMVSASAARTADGKLLLALVNASPDAEQSVDLTGLGMTKASGRILTAKSMDARNTFEQPDTVQPMPVSAKAKKGSLVLTLPARSVVVVTLGK